MNEWLGRIFGAVGARGLASNPGLKLVALLPAILTWFVIANQERSEMVLNAPITVNLPEGLTPTAAPPDEVTVRLKGRRNALARLTPSDVQVSVDLARAQEGRQIVLLDKQNLNVPFGIELVSIAPSSLDLELVSIVERRVPIRPNLTGEVPEGHLVSGTTVEPAEARVSGPESLFTETLTMSTEPVKLNGRENTFSTRVRVLTAVGDLQVVSPEFASVSVRIEEVRGRRTLTVRVETSGTPDGRVQINPADLTVTLEGPVSRIAALQPADLKVLVNIDALSPRDADYHLIPEVSLRRPDAFAGVEVAQLGQPRIDVHVYPRPAGP